MSKKKIVFMKDFVESNWGVRPPALKADGIRLRSAATNKPELTPEQEYITSYNLLMSEMLELAVINIDPKIFGEYTPDNFKKYIDKLADVHTAALTFTTIILPKVRLQTNTEHEQLGLLSKQLVKCIGYVHRIIEDPASEFIKERLRIEIEDTRAFVKDIIDNTDSLLKDFTRGQKNINSQAADLASIAELMLKDKTIDEAKINEIRKEIKKVQQEISSEKAVIVGYSVAIGASVVFTTVAFFINTFAGVAFLFFLLPVVGMSSYKIYSTYEKIKELQDKVNKQEKEISKYEVAILALAKTADQYLELSKKTSSLQKNLKDIKDIWDKIDKGLNEMSEDLQNSADWDKQTWTEVKQELIAAQKKAQQLCDVLSKIIIKKNDTMVTRETVQTGLTQEQFQSFVENAEKVTIEEYLKNQVA